MRYTGITLIAASLLAPPAVALAQPMPIFVTPYYDAKGPVVNVGKFSEGLKAVDREAIAKVVKQMQGERATLPVEAMYVAAIRLYDTGLRDESVSWFYLAQYRARLLMSVFDPGKVGSMGAPAFELRSALGSFQELAGTFINGYAGCSQKVWLAGIDAALADSKTLPRLATIYPRVALLPEKEWAAKNAEVAAGLGKLREFVSTQWDSITASRKQNDADEKYCPAK
jgi:hypothetical protein